MRLAKSERGWAMPLALLIVAVAAFLSLAVYQYAMTDNLRAAHDRDREKARYLARSGAEAVIKTWMDSDIDSKPLGSIETICQLKDGSFKLQSRVADSSEIAGRINVAVTQNPDGSTKFAAEAAVNDVTQKVTATSSVYTTGEKLNWYDSSGVINWNQPNVKPFTVHNDLTGRDEAGNLNYSDPSGIVVCDPPNSLHFAATDTPNGEAADDSKDKAGFIGQSIFINPDLDLSRGFVLDNQAANTANTNGKGILIISARNIVFNGAINLFSNNAGSFSTLALHVPSQIGMKIDDSGNLYGVVYFNKDVNIRFVSWTYIMGIPMFPTWYDDKVVTGPSAYYFKLRYDENREVGLNLLDWYNYSHRDIYNLPYAHSYDASDFIKITDEDDKNKYPPRPQDSVTFTWDW